MSEEGNSTTNNETTDSKDTLTGLEDELLQKKPKSTLKLIYTILAISFFFGAFNLTIFFNNFLLPDYLCSPLVFACQAKVEHDPNAALELQVFSTVRTLSTIVFMIALVVGGAISDDVRSRFGNRAPMILFGAIIAGIGYASFPILARGNNFAIVLLVSSIIFVVIHIGLGFALAPDYALISELFIKEERGWAGLGFAGIGLIGTLIGYALQDVSKPGTVLPDVAYPTVAAANTAWITTGLIAGGVIIFLGLLTFILTPKYNPPFPADGTVSDILATPRYLFEMGSGNSANRDFLLMFIIGILWGGGGYIIDTYFASFLKAMKDKSYITIDPANLLLLIGIAAAFFAAPAGVVIAKLGKIKSGMIGSIMLGFFTFMVAQSFIWADNPIYALALVAAAGTIFITAVNVSLPADLVPRGKEGQFMGLFIIAANLLSPLAGALATFISVQFKNDALTGYSTIFLLPTILYFIAVFILAFMHYEEQLEGEYQMYYRRYLLFKGYVSDKARFTALKVSSSLRLKKSR